MCVFNNAAKFRIGVDELFLFLEFSYNFRSALSIKVFPPLSDETKT